MAARNVFPVQLRYYFKRPIHFPFESRFEGPIPRPLFLRHSLPRIKNGNIIKRIASLMASSDRTYVGTGPGPGLIQCQSIGTGPVPT